MHSGDRNTFYFHKIANHRAKTNSITQILDANNVLQSDPVKVGSMFVHYYDNLFPSAGTHMSDEIFDVISTCVPQMIQSFLSLVFTREEVKISIKSMRPTIASGPDRMTALFYQ